MKRSMDLVRAILLDLEGLTPDLTNDRLGYDLDTVAARLGTDKEQLQYHLVLLYEADYIDGFALRGLSHKSGKAMALDSDYAWLVIPHHITWAGHEFLDTVRDEKAWLRTKEIAKDVGGFGVETLKELAKGLVKKQIKDFTGVEL
jgi:hypothetical protein